MCAMRQHPVGMGSDPSGERTAVVLFTRDLRVHDHAGLSEAAGTHEHVVPLFVLDERLFSSHGSPNRAAFLLESLADLRRSLRERAADLIVRQGDPVEETLRVAVATGSDTVFVSADASAYAAAREERLTRECGRGRIGVRVVDTTAVVPAGAVVPSGRDHYRVFTPYWRRWKAAAVPRPVPPPGRFKLPPGLAPGELPALRQLVAGAPSPARASGGEREARIRLERWLHHGLPRFEEHGEALAADATSRLSPYLHFGCVSARELAHGLRARPHGEAFLRRLCWRDFFSQLLAANPETTRADLRPRVRRWHQDDEALARWREGRTGYPIVDAAMRQLWHEGWLPNRARLIAASFLTRNLGLDWRVGARVFSELLVDGDVASNVGNWQWVAGTGASTRPNQVLNPIVQAKRYDPDGEYTRRHVPELRLLEGPSVHQPWDAARRLVADYPEPIAGAAPDERTARRTLATTYARSS
jgi:deoxyribodipyrimidine photo-lyase